MKRLTAILLAALLTAACSGDSKAQKGDTETVEQTQTSASGQPAPESAAESQPGMAMGSMMSEMCPMHVEGTTMTMDKTDEGMVMHFANPSNVDEVQRRAQMMMAQHHEKMSAMHGEKMSAEHGEGMSGGMHHQHRDGEMPAFSLMAENTEDGARLVMKPQNGEQMAKMQKMMADRRAMQGDSPCPMMMMMMGESSGEGHPSK